MSLGRFLHTAAAGVLTLALTSGQTPVPSPAPAPIETVDTHMPPQIEPPAFDVSGYTPIDLASYRSLKVLDTYKSQDGYLVRFDDKQGPKQNPRANYFACTADWTACLEQDVKQESLNPRASYMVFGGDDGEALFEIDSKKGASLTCGEENQKMKRIDPAILPQAWAKAQTQFMAMPEAPDVERMDLFKVFDNTLLLIVEPTQNKDYRAFYGMYGKMIEINIESAGFDIVSYKEFISNRKAQERNGTHMFTLTGGPYDNTLLRIAPLFSTRPSSQEGEPERAAFIGSQKLTWMNPASYNFANLFPRQGPVLTICGLSRQP